MAVVATTVDGEVDVDGMVMSVVVEEDRVWSVLKATKQ